MAKDFSIAQELTIYVFINEELQLSLGESTAQTAHAVAQMTGKMPAIVNSTMQAYVNNPSRVVVLTAQNSAHLQTLLQYCEETLGIYADGYIDEAYQCKMTAVATQPISKAVGEVFSEFWRYGRNTKTKRCSVYPPIYPSH